MTVFVKFNLLVIAILSFAVALLGYSGGYSFPPANIFFASVLPVMLFGPLGLFYTYIRPDSTIAVPCMNITTYSLFIPPIVLFGQLMGGLNYPLVDSQLAAFDATLGINWLSIVTYFASLPEWVSIYSTKLYSSTDILGLLVAVFLIFSGKHKRLEEFVTYFILTAIIVNIFAGFFPAASAYEYFKPSSDLYARLSPIVGEGYMNDFFALRNGEMHQLKLIGANGIVSFPSFHTIIALLLAYVVRGCGLTTYLVGIWCLGIVATTPFDGAHYVADIIGGGVTLMATIAVMQRLEPHLTRILSPHTDKTEPAPQPAFSA
jgi:hypothetical protein